MEIAETIKSFHSVMETAKKLIGTCMDAVLNAWRLIFHDVQKIQHV